MQCKYLIDNSLKYVFHLLPVRWLIQLETEREMVDKTRHKKMKKKLEDRTTHRTDHIVMAYRMPVQMEHIPHLAVWLWSTTSIPNTLLT